MIANNAFWQRLPAHVQDIVAPMQAWSIRFADPARTLKMPVAASHQRVGVSAATLLDISAHSANMPSAKA
jgi:hypothetical protein